MLRPLSWDPPRAALLSLLLLAGLLALAFAPFLFDGPRALDTAAGLCIFIVLAASYDVLLGYAGLVSFAHAIFFAMGAQDVASRAIHLGGTTRRSPLAGWPGCWPQPWSPP